MSATHTTLKGETMKKVTWIVMKNDSEIIRVKTKKMAQMIADDIGGYVSKYTVEGGQ